MPRMTALRLWGFALAATALCLQEMTAMAADDQAARLYVAPNGNDDWSGRLAEPRDADGPFASLERARAEVRDLSTRLGEWHGATVYVRAGTYELHEPFVLGPEDSGTEEHPVVYRACEDEKPVLIGAREGDSGRIRWRPLGPEVVLGLAGDHGQERPEAADRELP